jgi:protein-tyrosine phosphatase
LPFAAGGGDYAALGEAGRLELGNRLGRNGNWHVGEGPHHGSVRVARSHGIDISKQLCRVFKVSDFDDFDLILVMDKSNLTNVLAMASNLEDAKKVRLLLGDQEVPDPYYTNLFEDAFMLIEKGCKKLIEDLKSNNPG